MTSSPETVRLGQLVGAHYRVEAEIGRGGMGVVVRALDLRLDRLVAIKTLPAHLSADPIIRERFLREARTAASLSHPNIVPIHHAAEVDDVVYFVMGLVEGRSVAQRVRDAGTFSPAEAIAVMQDVSAALRYAHEKGVIHRDIKAENILLDPAQDRAMVTDFGIARLAEAAPMTATGTVLGSVHYMSPEQVSGDAVDGRSDLYALGVLGFFMLSGRFPFEHEAASAVLVAHVTRPAPPVRSIAPRVPVALADVVDQLLQKNPRARLNNAAAVSSALARASGRLDEAQPPAPPAILSSTEAQAVWERAALLQEMTGQVVPPPLPRGTTSAQPATSGFQLDEVRSAAQGAGIEPKYVEKALAERLPGAGASGLIRPGKVMDEKVNPWMGARTRLEYEATIPGELDDAGLDEISDELRRSIGEFGSVSSRRGTVEFTAAPTTANGMPRRMQVSVTSRNGRTTIRAFEDFRQMAGGVIGGITGGVGGGVGGASFGIIMGVTKTVLLAAPVFAGVALCAYAGARYVNHRVARSKEREILSLMERLIERVQELVEQPSALPARGQKRIGR